MNVFEVTLDSFISNEITTLGERVICSLETEIALERLDSLGSFVNSQQTLPKVDMASLH